MLRAGRCYLRYCLPATAIRRCSAAAPKVHYKFCRKSTAAAVVPTQNGRLHTTHLRPEFCWPFLLGTSPRAGQPHLCARLHLARGSVDDLYKYRGCNTRCCLRNANRCFPCFLCSVMRRNHIQHPARLGTHGDVHAHHLRKVGPGGVFKTGVEKDPPRGQLHAK